MANAQELARQIIEQMPDHATWNDIIHTLYVKQKIELGLKAAEAGHTVSDDQAKQRLR